MSAVAHPKGALHVCARCGSRRRRADMVYSRTGVYYCGPRFDEPCNTRARRRRRAEGR